MSRALTIGQVAKATGVAVKTIRYYEQIGALPSPPRSPAGYRQYDGAGVERLRFISRARSLGLPLQQLRFLTTALNGRLRTALRPRLQTLVQEQLAAVQHQIAELELLRQELERVSHRIRHAHRRRAGGACRCLDTDDPTPRQHHDLAQRA